MVGGRLGGRLSILVCNNLAANQQSAVDGVTSMFGRKSKSTLSPEDLALFANAAQMTPAERLSNVEAVAMQHEKTIESLLKVIAGLTEDVTNLKAYAHTVDAQIASLAQFGEAANRDFAEIEQRIIALEGVQPVPPSISDIAALPIPRTLRRG
jgi:septal ring factor EnvC (AmiA/AmiB activator)